MTKRINNTINLTELSRTIDEFKSALFTVITNKRGPSEQGEEHIEDVSRERLKQDIDYIKVSLKEMRRFIEKNTEYHSPIRYYITQQSIAIEKTLDTIKSSVIWQNKMIAKDNME